MPRVLKKTRRREGTYIRKSTNGQILMSAAARDLMDARAVVWYFQRGKLCVEPMNVPASARVVQIRGELGRVMSRFASKELFDMLPDGKVLGTFNELAGRIEFEVQDTREPKAELSR